MRVNVQVYIIDETLKNLLILKRTPERSGYWQPVCGGVEQHEELRTTALREVYEETGITLDEDNLTQLPFEFSYTEPKNGIVMEMKDYCFMATITEEIDINISEEHEQYIWINPKDISEYTTWEPILDVVDYLINSKQL